MNSFENLGSDPSKLSARRGSKNLAWKRSGKRERSRMDQAVLGRSFRHLQEKSRMKTKKTNEKNENGEEKEDEDAGIR